MLQLTQKTSPVLPSAARAGQSKTAQPPPPRSLVHLPAAAPLVPAVLRRRPQQACPSPLPARVPHQQVPESPVMATSPPRPHSSHPVFRSATTCWALVSKHQGNVTNQTAPASALAELTFKTGDKHRKPSGWQGSQRKRGKGTESSGTLLQEDDQESSLQKPEASPPPPPASTSTLTLLWTSSAPPRPRAHTPLVGHSITPPRPSHTQVKPRHGATTNTGSQLSNCT